jgi:hypothetical protein
VSCTQDAAPALPTSAPLSWRRADSAKPPAASSQHATSYSEGYTRSPLAPGLSPTAASAQAPIRRHDPAKCILLMANIGFVLLSYLEIRSEISQAQAGFLRPSHGQGDYSTCTLTLFKQFGLTRFCWSPSLESMKQRWQDGEFCFFSQTVTADHCESALYFPAGSQP